MQVQNQNINAANINIKTIVKYYYFTNLQHKIL